jgi:hypothetical protein
VGQPAITVASRVLLKTLRCLQACGRDQGIVFVHLATGVVARTEKIEVDLRVAFNDFDSVQSYTVLDMDGRFDLILEMPWLERHEP